MKIRTLIVGILGVLVVSTVSPAQDAKAPEQEPQEQAFLESTSPPLPQLEPSFVAQAASPTTPRPEAPRLRRGQPMATPPTVPSTPAAKKTPTVVKIFQLRHTMVEELARLIESVFSIEVYQDHRMNRLIVNATQEQMESIESLIAATDVEAPEASTSPDIQNLVYRIYMLEIPSGDQDMKPFSIILKTTADLSSTELLDAVMYNDLHISEVLQSSGEGERETEFLIQGRAASDNSIKNMVGSIPNSRIKQFIWDDAETFTNKMEAAQYTQLPEQMQKHIAKFLGDEIQTVGYWFGNLSVPGKVQAPIGPWTLTLQLDTESDRMLELDVNVEMPGEMNRFDRRIGRERNNEVLSNTIRAKIGKPVIIGYNRESYGTRKMGAMVIIPEVDTIQ